MIDTTPRYTPDFVIIAQRMKLFPVERVVIYPPGKHPQNSAIKPELTAVELVTEAGSRWWGFERAWINSELRAVVVGFPARDELRSKWEIVPDDGRRAGGK